MSPWSSHLTLFGKTPTLFRLSPCCLLFPSKSSPCCSMSSCRLPCCSMSSCRLSFFWILRGCELFRSQQSACCCVPVCGLLTFDVLFSLVGFSSALPSSATPSIANLLSPVLPAQLSFFRSFVFVVLVICVWNDNKIDLWDLSLSNAIEFISS